MVQFPRYRLTTPPGRDVERLTALRVTPFGHPRISGCLLLLVAYRSLPRPSSPSSSKASAVDPCPLAISPISPSLCPMPLEKDPVRSTAAPEVRRRKPAHRCQRPVVTRRQRIAAQRRHHLSFDSRPRRNCVAGSRSGVASLRIGPGRIGRVESEPVEVWGLEPQTYGLQSHRSSHLSYTPAGRHRRSTLWSAPCPGQRCCERASFSCLDSSPSASVTTKGIGEERGHGQAVNPPAGRHRPTEVGAGTELLKRR